MNPQIMQMKIKLAECKKEFKEKSIKVTRLFQELGTLYNPWFGENVESIEAEKISQIAKEMTDLKTDLLALQSTIKTLKKELGED